MLSVEPEGRGTPHIAVFDVWEFVSCQLIADSCIVNPHPSAKSAKGWATDSVECLAVERVGNDQAQPITLVSPCYRVVRGSRADCRKR